MKAYTFHCIYESGEQFTRTIWASSWGAAADILINDWQASGVAAKFFTR